MNPQLRIACASVVLLAAAVCFAEPLRTVRPSTHKMFIEQGGSINVQDGMSLAVATALYRALPHEAQVGQFRPSIYKLPGLPHLFVVTADGPEFSDRDYGLCLYVFGRRASLFRLLFRSTGMQDSYILEPTFFVGSGRTLVLAETGDETGTLGLYGFEITPTRTRNVGLLDAAGRDPHHPDCLANPLRESQIDFVNETYVVRVRGEVYLHPGTQDQRKLPGSGWHKFVSDGKQFLYKP